MVKGSLVAAIVLIVVLATWFGFGRFYGPVEDSPPSPQVAPEREVGLQPELQPPRMEPPKALTRRVPTETPAEALADTPTSESIPRLRSVRPDLLFHCALPPGLEPSELEVGILDLRGRDIGPGNPVRIPAGEDLARGATLAVVAESERGYLEVCELRSRDRRWSSGFLYTRGLRASGAVLPIVLRPVNRARLWIVDESGEPITVTRPDLELELRSAQEVFALPREEGEPLEVVYNGVVEVEAESRSFRIERCLGGTVQLLVSHPLFETHESWLQLAPGELGEHRITFRRLPTAGTLSGRVTTQSGHAPLPAAWTGSVRIVSTEDPKRRFTVELLWTDGVAEWESPPLPFGEYRVWLADTGSLFATLLGEDTLSPPRTRVDWVWHDASEARNLGLTVRDAENGAAIEVVHVETFFNEEDSSDGRVWTPLLVREGVPVDSPWRWEVYAPGYERVALGIEDFTEQRTVTPDEVPHIEAPIEVWIAPVALKRTR